MEIDQGETPVGNVDDRMLALLDGPDDGEPEEEEEGGTETEGGEEAADEPAEEAEPEPEYEEITHNGETKKLTKDEIKVLAQQGFDYTQKTQQLAEARRQFDVQVQAARQSLAIQNEQVETIAELKALDGKLAQFKEINWIQLAESDPVEYLKLNQSYRDLKDVRDTRLGEFQHRAQELQRTHSAHLEQTIAQEREHLAAKLPEFRGDKAKEATQKLRSFLAQNGFNDAEIGNVLDHRAVIVAWKAMQYDALKSSQPAKKVAEIPKVVKPGAPQNQRHNASQELRSQLRKTGKQDYATKLIEQML